MYYNKSRPSIAILQEWCRDDNIWRVSYSMNSTELKNQSRSTILVVDDDRTLRDTLEYNLRREGYHVLTAADGDEAVRLALSGRPDLIVLDIMLPGMNGFDVCRAVRKQSTVPILMLSAREEEIDKVLGLELGADDYLTKPFGLRELLARIHAMLRRVEILQPQSAQPSPASAAPGDSANRAADAEPAPLLVA